MRNCWKKVATLLILALMNSVLFSENNCCDYGPGYTLDEHRMIGAYNAPEKLCLRCPCNVYLEGSFIFWEARETGLDIANVIENGSKTKFIKIPFSYKPGFKVALGKRTNRDSWHGFLQYTRLKSSKDVSKTANANEIFYPQWSIPAPPTLTDPETSLAKENWDLDYNVFDLALGRSFYVGTKFTISPYFGLKGGWLDQKVLVNYNEYQPPSVDKYPTLIKVDSDSWMIGPRVGTEADYLVFSKIKLFAKAAASLLYQYFDLSFKQTREGFENIFLKDKNGYINPFLEMSLGFCFSSYFSCQRWYLSILASYDFNIFWDQNLLRSCKDSLGKHIDGANGDLMLHGLTLSVKMDF